MRHRRATASTASSPRLIRKIRFKQRQDAGKASINGQTLVPIEKTVANGKKLVEIRANITDEAIKKALAAK